jgi:hypothetical protein
VEVEEGIADLAALEEVAEGIVAPSRQPHLVEVRRRVVADMSSRAVVVLEAWLEAPRQTAAAGSIAVVRSWLLLSI